MELKKSILINLSVQTFSRLVNVLLVLLFLGALSKDDFSRITIFQSTIIIISTICSQGLSTYLLSVSNLEIANGHRKQRLLIVICLGVVALNILLFIVLFFLGDLFKLFETSLWQYMFSSIFFSIHLIYTSFLQRTSKMVKMAVYNFSQSIFILISFHVIQIAKVDSKINAYFYLIVFAYVIVLPFIISDLKGFKLAATKNIGYRVINVLRSSNWQFLYFSVLILGTQVDLIVLNNLISKKYIADYSLAFRFFSLSTLVTNIINVSLLPFLSSQDNSSMRELYVDTYVKKLLPIGCVIYLVILMLPNDLVRLLPNGKDYFNAVVLFKVLSFSFAVSIVFSPVVNFLFAEKKEKVIFLINLCIVVLTLPLKFFLTIKFQNFGMAIASVLSVSLLPICLFIYYKIKY